MAWSWNEEINNKLHSLNLDLNKSWTRCYRNDRREEVVLARSRIGHTHYTHSYLLKGEDRPDCIPCAEPLTVKHILIDYAIISSRHFHVFSLKDLFEKVDPSNILAFIKEIGLFYKFWSSYSLVKFWSSHSLVEDYLIYFSVQVTT